MGKKTRDAEVNGNIFAICICRCACLDKYSSWKEIWAEAIIRRQGKSPDFFNDQFALVLKIRKYYEDNDGTIIDVYNFHGALDISHGYVMEYYFKSMNDLWQACGFPCRQPECRK